MAISKIPFKIRIEFPCPSIEDYIKLKDASKLEDETWHLFDNCGFVIGLDKINEVRKENGM